MLGALVGVLLHFLSDGARQQQKKLHDHRSGGENEEEVVFIVTDENEAVVKVNERKIPVKGQVDKEREYGKRRRQKKIGNVV